MPSYKMLLNRFVRTVYVMDLRPDAETRRLRCERYARKNRTEAKGPARFQIDIIPWVPVRPYE